MFRKSTDDFQNDLNDSNKNIKIISELPQENYQRYFNVSCLACGRNWKSSYSSLLYNKCAGCNKKVKGSLENTQLHLIDRKIKVSGDYKNAHSKLHCVCEICECNWSAHSHNLLNGKRGCPSCSLTGYDPQKSGNLYYLKVVYQGEVYWKIGITNLTLKERYRPSDRSKIETIFFINFNDGSIPMKLEKEILFKYKEFRVKNKRPLQTGNTELFTKDVLSEGDSPWQI